MLTDLFDARMSLGTLPKDDCSRYVLCHLETSHRIAIARLPRINMFSDIVDAHMGPRMIHKHRSLRYILSHGDLEAHNFHMAGLVCLWQEN